MPTLRSGPLVGLMAQLILLAALAETLGLGVAGWTAGIAYGVVLCFLLLRGLHHEARPDLGPADRITMARAVLVGGVTALATLSFLRPVPVALIATLTVVALALDGVDGYVARRTGTSSSFGARFDMEVDAYLLLVLSAYLGGTIGWWILAIGGMRYAYVAAMWVLPWMRGQLPPRYWRKVVAAVQGIALVVTTTGVLPGWVNVLGLLVALGLLVESFGRDVLWLWSNRPVTVRLVHAYTEVAA